MPAENCVDKETCAAKHTGLDKLVEDMDGDIKAVGKEVGDMRKSINTSLTRIHEKIEKFAMRPSWGVVVVITGLTSLSVGLIVKMVFA